MIIRTLLTGGGQSKSCQNTLKQVKNDKNENSMCLNKAILILQVCMLNYNKIYSPITQGFCFKSATFAVTATADLCTNLSTMGLLSGNHKVFKILPKLRK